MGFFLPALAALAIGGANYGLGKKSSVKSEERPRLNLKDLSEFPTGAVLNDRILAALQKGEGIGFPKGYEERATSPFIASREAGWSQKELPFLSGEYGGRGLGRSTLATRDIGQAYATKERDINEMIANAYLNNLTQSKADTARYENLGYDFSGSQADVQNKEEMLNSGIDANNINTRNAYNKEQAQILPAAISTGLSAFTGGISGDNKLLDAITKSLNTDTSSKASPFTTGINSQIYDASLQSKFPNLFKSYGR